VTTSTSTEATSTDLTGTDLTGTDLTGTDLTGTEAEAEAASTEATGTDFASTDRTVSATSAPSDGHPRRWLVLGVLAAVAFMAQLDLFIVNIAVPAMGHSFGGVGLSSLSWVLNAYAIVFAALLVPAGRLADHYGRKLFLLIGVATFTLASVLCAVAPVLDVLVLGRVIQAAGAAMIVPSSLGLLLAAFPRRQHTLAVGIWAGVAAVAASSGAPVGGLLVAVDWRLIFLINVPIGVATLLLGIRVLPEVRAQPGAHLPDGLSVLSLLAAVTLLTLAIVQGPSWGWGSAADVGLFVIAAAATAVTVLRILRHPHALIEARLFRSREFSTATITLFLFFVAFSVWLLVTVLFLQDQWHYSALRAGLGIAPGPLTAAVFAVNSGRIGARFGRTAPAATGALFIAASAGYLLAFAPVRPSYVAAFLPSMILGGIGAGLAQAPLFAAASGLPADRATTGSAVLNMARQLGSAVGVAVLVALLASPVPHGLDLFRRGWILEAVVATAAAVALVLLRSGLTARPAHSARPARPAHSARPASPPRSPAT
jgi:EmrB/QacA subfamily drug resistance transporter